MEEEKNPLKLYSDVESVPVDWLWYPYIPYGKITILQGDPGDGKSTLIMNVISALTTAGFMPDGTKIEKARKVIYQCSEDGVADTIKPRLESYGADCSMVAFLLEDDDAITLDDDRIRNAIIDFKAKLLVIDPIQAYLGEGADLSNAKRTRKLMKKLGTWAAVYDCAIVLVGHLNKKENSKDLYRSLGSIDLMAAARSVLQVFRVEGSESVRFVRQIKNSLAPTGKDIGFAIDSESGFKWIDDFENADPHYEIERPERHASQEIAAELLKILLSSGPVKAVDVRWYFGKHNVSMRTANRAKKTAGVKSIRKDGQWYWVLESGDDGK